MSVSTTTGDTPHFLMTGRKLRMSVSTTTGDTPHFPMTGRKLRMSVSTTSGDTPHFPDWQETTNECIDKDL